MNSGSGSLTSAVIDLAAAAARANDAGLAAAGKRVEWRLQRPLCVALVGRMKSGKSTLLNALVSAPAAPTAQGECTKVVYVFRYLQWDTAQVVPRDGSPNLPLDLDQSRLPDELPLPASEIRLVDVTFANQNLREFTLIDTPGLASPNEENSAVTQRLLRDTSDAAVDADALLFCLNGPLHDDEERALREFAEGRGGGRLTGGTAVGVLTKADENRTGLRGDPWKASTELAEKMSRQHANLFASVVPVVGLLAATAKTGALREAHARALATLARQWSADDVVIATSSENLYHEYASTIPEAQRAELIGMLGMFGLREIVQEIRAGRPAVAGELTEVARRISGYDEMRSRLSRLLSQRSDVLKAAAALEELVAAGERAGDEKLLRRAHDFLDLPDMFPLRVIEMGRILAQGTVRPPSGLIEQAWITVQDGVPADAADHAREYIRRWREWGSLTDSAGRRVAQVMVRALQLASSDRR